MTGKHEFLAARAAAALLALLLMLSLAACAPSGGQTDGEVSAPGGETAPSQDVTDEEPARPEGTVESLPVDGSSAEVTLSGETHTLAFSVDPEDEYTLHMSLDGEERDIGYGCRLGSAWVITCADGVSGILVDADLASDDFVTYAMRFENGEFTAAEEIDGGLYQVEAGGFTVTSWIDCVGTRYGMRSCTVLEGFQVIVDEIYSFYGALPQDPPALEFTNEGTPENGDALPPADAVVTQTELRVTRTEDNEEVVLPAGTALSPLRTDLAKWVTFRTEDGSEVVAELSLPGEDAWCVNIGGMPETDVFADLIFAG